jgi:arylsulfatase A-like enzyme
MIMKTKGYTIALALLAIAAGAQAKPDAPNLVIILADDLGYKDVGFNGCTDIPTPHIDQIAAQGVKFTDGYVSYPVCGPSRAGLLTGRYQDRFGFTTNPTIDPTNPTAGIPLEEENIAEVLRKVRYSSAIIGKWHMGTHEVHHPLNRGFDHFFGFLSGGHNYFPSQYTLNDLSEVNRKWDWYRTRLIKDRERVDVQGDYLTDILSDAAVTFIDSKVRGDQPFLLYLAYNAPHTPLQATEKYLNRFPQIENKSRRTYAAMVSSLDDGVGRVLEALRRHGIEENTLVVFLSDNGGPLKKGQPAFTDNGALAKGKGSLFEGGVRVPFAMQWKGTLPAGQVYTNPVISLDIMATITALADVEIAVERPLDGVNLIPHLTGPETQPPHDQLFWRKFENNGISTRKGSMKLVSDERRERDNYELFDLSRDIGERQNLRSLNPEQAEQLIKDCENWNAGLKDRFFPTLGEDQWWKTGVEP